MSGSHHLITCVMPAGRGREVLNRLREAHHVIDLVFHHARGAGNRRNRRGRLMFVDRDVAQVLVRAEQADAVFEFLYRAAGLDQGPAGMIWMTAAGRASAMPPPAGFIEF